MIMKEDRANYIPHPPIQQNPAVIAVEMRKLLGAWFGATNRAVPNIGIWAAKDKKNTAKLNDLAQRLIKIVEGLKDIIVENEKLSGLSMQGLEDFKQKFQYTHKNKQSGKWDKFDDPNEKFPSDTSHWKAKLQQQARKRDNGGSWRDELARQNKGE